MLLLPTCEDTRFREQSPKAYIDPLTWRASQLFDLWFMCVLAGCLMSKLPAFQFYPGDWRKDAGVQALNFHDRGVWFEILCFMHESEQRGKLLLNGRPMSESALSKLLGLDNQILTTTLTTLLEYGVVSKCVSTGALMSRRMVRDEEIREVRKSCGKLGGNPNLLNQNSTIHLNQIPTPSARKMKNEDEERTPTKFNALKEIFGEPKSQAEEKKFFDAFQGFLKLEATPEEISKRAEQYKKNCPNLAFTPYAVLHNWEKSTPKAKKPYNPLNP